jgi:cation transport ATPase
MTCAACAARLIVSTVLSAPVVAVSMVPALQFPYWAWFGLALATPVVAYGGWPFHRAALINLRHGSSTMDTLISAGTLAACAAPGEEEDEVLRRAAAVEHASAHPIARAIAERSPAGVAVTEFRSVDGLGVVGTVEVTVGRPEFLAQRGLELGETLSAAADRTYAAARTVVGVGWDGRARAIITVGHTVKPTSAVAVARRRELGLEPILLTGANPAAARAVAYALGIEQVTARALPADKVEAVRQLQEQGRVVAMVGDGVNDAAAPAQADLGIALGTVPTRPCTPPTSPDMRAI